MGGLFGGGKKKSSGTNQEPNPPVDTSGSKIPGDDKMVKAMQDTQRAQAATDAKAKETLLGREANPEELGGALDKTSDRKVRSVTYNYS